jgi:hypothetical protein
MKPVQVNNKIALICYLASFFYSLACQPLGIKGFFQKFPSNVPLPLPGNSRSG